MDHVSTAVVQSDLTHYKCAGLGGHGEDFQRRIALLLLQRVILGETPFRLAFEIEAAGKFDDVALYLDQRDEWWLIQAKHAESAGDLSFDALFPKDEKGKKSSNFSIFKYLESYVYVRDYWPHGGSRIMFFLFTNKGLDGNVASEPADRIDKLFVFSSVGEHLKLKPSESTIRDMLDFVNNQFQKIVEVIIKLFEGGVMSDLLNNYKTPLSEILISSNGKVHFSENFTAAHHNPRVHQLYKRLQIEFESRQKDISTISVSRTKEMNKFFTGRSRFDVLPPQTDIETVTDFFNHFILSVKQPNADELLRVINKEWTWWMKSWIQPDDFGRLNLSQLEQPFNAFKRCFEDWEKEGSKNESKAFLDFNRGEQFINQVQEELCDVVEKSSKRSCVSLREIQRFYINRRISTQNGCLTDKQFIEKLPEDENCFLLVAEPGMGKSTLWQYLAFHTQQEEKKSGSTIFLLYLNNLTGPLGDVEGLASVPGMLKTELSLESLSRFEQRNQKLFLFMDAFDELSSVNEEKVLKLVEIVQKRGNARILISSRRRVQEKLEKRLKISAMMLESFSREDQIVFLRKFWEVTDTELDRFDSFSSKLLSKFHSDIKRQEYDFTGMPLMLKMLADIYADEFKVYLGTGISDFESGGKLTVIDLYEKFVAKCIAITINKKMNTDNRNEVHSFFDPLYEAWENFYQLFAISMFLSDSLLIKINESDFSDKIERIKSKIVQKQEESLLVEAVGGNPQFTHLSYGEFFAAKFLYCFVVRSSDSTSYGEIVQNLNDHEAIRHFFLAMINAKPEGNSLEFIKYQTSTNLIVRWCSRGDFVNLIEYLNDFYDYTRTMDDNHEQRPLLHMAAEHNACQTLQFLLKSVANVDMKGHHNETAFQNACQRGCLGAVELLVSSGANIDQIDETGCTGLHLAAKSGNVELVQYLLDRSPSQLDTINKKGKTALHEAIEENKTEVALFLIQRGAKVDLLDNLNRSPLLLAVQNQRKDVIECLIEHGADIDQPDRRIFRCAVQNGCANFVQLWLDRNLLVTEYDLASALENGRLRIAMMLVASGISPHITHYGITPEGNSSMHYAVLSGNVDVVKYLIEQSVELDTQNSSGKTPLHLAAEDEGREGIARLLISKNADIGAIDFVNESVLFTAAKFGNKPLVQILLGLSVELDVQNLDRSTALHEAIKSNQEPIVRLLLQAGADVNLQGETRNTALHHAVISGNKEIVDLMLEKSNNIDALNMNGRTPLLLAAEHGHKDIAKLLIANHANINHADDKGRTTLQTAILYCNREVAEILIEHVTEYDTRDQNGGTSLHYAVGCGYPEILALLIERGASVNAKDNRGCTPLHEAATIQKTKYAKILIEMGADVMARNDIGKTALQIAQSWGDWHMEELLRANGAYLTEEDEKSKGTACIALG